MNKEYVVQATRVHMSKGWSLDSRQEYFNFKGRLVECDYDYLAFRLSESRGLRRYVELHPSELEYLACSKK